MTYEPAIRREIERWPGVAVEFTTRGKHAAAVLRHGGLSRFVIYPVSPSDSRRGAANCLADVRRELRRMGAAPRRRKG